MRELATTLLDVLGLLLVAAGIAAAAALVIGRGPSLTVAGVVVLAGSWWFAKPPTLRQRPGQADEAGEEAGGG